MSTTTTTTTTPCPYDACYTGSGTISLKGCFTYSFSEYLPYKYIKGDVVFVKPSALKGKLEKIAIKDVKVISGKKTYGQIIFLYVDTFNFFYNENELISEQEAINLAKQYYENKINIANAAKISCEGQSGI